MGKIIWLASYPKSGNTWLRVVLTNYLRDSAEPADINDLERTHIASGRALFDEIMGISAADLTPTEIACLRPALYEQLAAESAEPLFMKVHDAYTYTPQGIPLLAKAATQGAIYLIRNPLDVAVSLAHHNNESLDYTIRRMNTVQDLLTYHPSSLLKQLPQQLLGWSGHVQSWLDEPHLSVHLLRYEAMQRTPLAAFGAALQFAGVAVEAARLQRALHHASFATLQQQEQRHGFGERLSAAQSFFRKGTIGDWRNVLTSAQVECLVQTHGAVMRRFGYLSETGEIRD
jgi:hypothetical protein